MTVDDEPNVLGWLTELLSVHYEVETVVDSRAGKKVLRVRQRPFELIAQSEVMRRTLAVALRAALTDSPVLLESEPGTGRTAVSQFIHAHSERREGPFLEIQGSTSPDLDAAFAQAQHGTLVIDGVDELAPEAQARLRAIVEASPNVRVIASSNAPLDHQMRVGRFRTDLYYCLCVIPLTIPPLRDRIEDIPALAAMFIRRTGRLRTLSAPAQQWLVERAWHGNVRELAGVIGRAAALSVGDTIKLAEIQAPTTAHEDRVHQGLQAAALRELSLDELERTYIAEVVASVDGNMSEAARVLGIDRRTLYRKLGEQG